MSSTAIHIRESRSVVSNDRGRLGAYAIRYTLTVPAAAHDHRTIHEIFTENMPETTNYGSDAFVAARIALQAAGYIRAPQRTNVRVQIEYRGCIAIVSDNPLD